MKITFIKLTALLLFLLSINTRLIAQIKRQESVPLLLKHIVVVTFKQGTTDDQISAVDHSFSNLAVKLKMVKGYEWGIGTDDHDTVHIKHVYITAFENKAEEAKYGASPEHQAHIRLGADYIESVSATDFYVEPRLSVRVKNIDMKN